MADADVAAAMAGSFLGRLSPELVGELLAAGDRIDCPAGSTIYREGSSPRTLLVVRGLLRVYMSSPEGRQVTVRYARASDVLGIAVLVGGPAEVGVQTVAESTVFRIDARRLTSAARTDGRVSWALAEELSRRLYETLEQTAINSFGSVRQRIAAHLLDLASTQPVYALLAVLGGSALADIVTPIAGPLRWVSALVLVVWRRGSRSWRYAPIGAVTLGRSHERCPRVRHGPMPRCSG